VCAKLVGAGNNYAVPIATAFIWYASKRILKMTSASGTSGDVQNNAESFLYFASANRTGQRRRW